MSETENNLASLIPTPAECAWMPPWIKSEYFENLKAGLPNNKTEHWKYIPVKVLKDFRVSTVAAENPTELAVKLKDSIRIDIFNGKLANSAENLPEGMSLHFQEKQEYHKLFAQNKDCFSMLNSIHSKGVLILEIADSAILDKVIHLNVQNKGDGQFFTPRVLIKAGKNCEVSIFETFNGEGSYFCNSQTDLILAENAKVNHIRVQNGHKDAIHVGNIRYFLERDSRCISHNYSFGAKFCRINTYAGLAENGSEIHLNGCYFVDGERYVDNHSNIEHLKPHCISRQDFKGLLDGKGHGVFNGRVFVEKDAQKTDSIQSNKNLLLSVGSRIDTKPQLEIYADDVKCAHGATIGQLNQEEIFYLQSRAFTKEEATQFLTRAFIEESILKIEDDNIKNYLDKLTLNYLKTE